MKFSAAIFTVVTLLIGNFGGFSQGFVNLGFENTTITPYPGGGSGRYIATVPGWAVNPLYFWNGDPPISIPLDDIALDAPAVTLQGTNGFFPAIQEKYSILLQGGTVAGGHFYNTNGASIWQTAQIPLIARSITYLGSSSLRVTFNGNPLSFFAMSSAPNYTVWGADISAYTGQMGELRFTSPWLSVGVLDGIRFSPSVIPEPSMLSLFGLCILSLCCRRRQRIENCFTVKMPQ